MIIIMIISYLALLPPHTLGSDVTLHFAGVFVIV